MSGGRWPASGGPIAEQRQADVDEQRTDRSIDHTPSSRCRTVLRELAPLRYSRGGAEADSRPDEAERLSDSDGLFPGR